VLARLSDQPPGRKLKVHEFVQCDKTLISRYDASSFFFITFSLSSWPLIFFALGLGVALALIRHPRGNLRKLA
jgi:hypothetical protein